MNFYYFIIYKICVSNKIQGFLLPVRKHTRSLKIFDNPINDEDLSPSSENDQNCVAEDECLISYPNNDTKIQNYDECVLNDNDGCMAHLF